MRLIDADALKEELEKLWNVHDDQDFANKDVWREIENAPTIDPERTKGKWTEDSDPGQIIGEHYSCSECRVCFGTLKSNFCPNCGADMQGE